MNQCILLQKIDTALNIKFVKRISRAAVPNREQVCPESRAASCVMGRKLQGRVHRRPGHLQSKASPHPFRVRPLLLHTSFQRNRDQGATRWQLLKIGGEISWTRDDALGVHGPVHLTSATLVALLSNLRPPVLSACFHSSISTYSNVCNHASIPNYVCTMYVWLYHPLRSI